MTTVFDLVDVVAATSALEEIHVRLRRSRFLLAEHNGLRGVGNGAQWNGVFRRELGWGGVQNDLEACQRLGREGFLEIIIPAIGEIASVGTIYVVRELF